MKVKTSILALTSLAMASFLLCHFAFIWIFGEFYIFESSKLVLVSETTLIVAIIGFSAFCLVDQLRRPR